MTEREELMINEAFTMGRVYSKAGEKESPHKIHDKLMQNCERAGGVVSSGAANVRQGQKGESGEVLRAEVQSLIDWCHGNCFKEDYSDNWLIKVPVKHLIRLDIILENALHLIEGEQDAQRQFQTQNRGQSYE